MVLGTKIVVVSGGSNIVAQQPVGVKGTRLKSFLRVMYTHESFKIFDVLYYLFDTLVYHMGSHTRNLLVSEIVHWV